MVTVQQGPDPSCSLLVWLRFVLLASGLGLGSSHADSMLGLQLLLDMVTGQLGEQGEQKGAAAITRVILAGNLLSQNRQEKDASMKVAPSVLPSSTGLFWNCLIDETCPV